jgi:hypothetical protein
MTKNFYKKKFLFYLSAIPILLITVIGNVYAQNNTNNGVMVTISGVVKDNEGPLPAVSVFVKGSSAGVTTNADGNFTIKATVGKSLTYLM